LLNKFIAYIETSTTLIRIHCHKESLLFACIFFKIYCNTHCLVLVSSRNGVELDCSIQVLSNRLRR